jgi:hypothetical protein
MSDGMAFLTGAAFAGVAVLFMIKGGTNIGAANIPSPAQLPIAPTIAPNNPYMTTPTMPNPTVSPGAAMYNNDQQRLDAERFRAMFEQQRMETEQLKAQLQNQQKIIDHLSTKNDPNNSPFIRSAPTTPAAAAPVAQQQDNPMLSGLVWALGGMAITISGGVVVVGALSVLSKQQRSGGRTTYVVQQPYNALPPTVHTRRRTAEVIPPPHLDERRVDYVEYDR